MRHHNLHTVLVILVTAGVSGCASDNWPKTDAWLHPASATALAIQDKTKLDNEGKAKPSDSSDTTAPDTITTPPSPYEKSLRARCILTETIDDGRPVCRYATIEILGDTEKIPSASETKKLANYLRMVSDNNCRFFINRAFGNKAAWDASKSSINSITTAISSGTAFNAPTAAAILGGINLVSGSIIDSINANYYQQQTFSAISTAIEAARLEQWKKITTEVDAASTDIYGLFAAVSAYDDLCSFKGALSALNKATTTARATAEAATAPAAAASR